MGKEFYKLKKSVITDRNIICGKSIIVNDNGKIYFQGGDKKLKNESFESLKRMDLLESLVETPELINYVNDYVIEPKEFRGLKKLIGELIKKFPNYSSQFNTIKTWVFSAKGSPAITITEEIKFQNNPDEYLKNTILMGGMKAKYGSPFKNRGTRQNVVSNPEEWEVDRTTLLPNGIRKSDSCTYNENIKIFKKVITEVLSMEDTPVEIIDYLSSKGFHPNKEKHIDFYYKTAISFNLFDKNTHHAKVKGLEFCHINPDIEYSSIDSNITIGTSESNRHQGGYSIEYTYKKILIKKIYENEKNVLTTTELNNMDVNELELLNCELKS